MMSLSALDIIMVQVCLVALILCVAWLKHIDSSGLERAH